MQSLVEQVPIEAARRARVPRRQRRGKGHADASSSCRLDGVDRVPAATLSGPAVEVYLSERSAVLCCALL